MGRTALPGMAYPQVPRPAIVGEDMIDQSGERLLVIASVVVGVIVWIMLLWALWISTRPIKKG